MVKQREQHRIQVDQERIAKEIAQEPLAIEKFLHKMMNHPWLVVRLFFKAIYGVWVVVMAIAMFLAWLIGVVVA
jgi:Fe2+ transport system protein B